MNYLYLLINLWITIAQITKSNRNCLSQAWSGSCYSNCRDDQLCCQRRRWCFLKEETQFKKRTNKQTNKHCQQTNIVNKHTNKHTNTHTHTHTQTYTHTHTHTHTHIHTTAYTYTYTFTSNLQMFCLNGHFSLLSTFVYQYGDVANVFFIFILHLDSLFLFDHSFCLPPWRKPPGF